MQPTADCLSHASLLTACASFINLHGSLYRGSHTVTIVLWATSRCFSQNAISQSQKERTFLLHFSAFLSTHRKSESLGPWKVTWVGVTVPPTELQHTDEELADQRPFVDDQWCELVLSVGGEQQCELMSHGRQLLA